MRRFLHIAVVCLILPCSACAVGNFLLEAVLNSWLDTDLELSDHATEGMSKSERARANAEYNNVESMND